ncbi:MAG: NAD-dependent epimerase/dehydratase family protein [Crenarchaeota archaeon]|nr:MAG: NAD-dependent epimerase/dehydratase family protein [Thermoproteota archaeon]RDJ33329.1 MAG: NAD-dependent epimerase/dehydratase family protein [Thermoproteota archaeon]RDJ36168.1 MAG: NAD-dependent epimerase/dehydratase family protein [Thermoproteota archaeon]
MKILITGGLGFIGSHLCDKLIKNNDLTIITKSTSKIQNILAPSKINIEKIDITNFSTVEKIIKKNSPEVIIHLAGQTSHSQSFENPLYDVDINSKSTLFMLETMRKLNLNCEFILGSTFVVVGKPKKLPINEESPCQPTTIYGANRLLSEHYCKIYHDVYGLKTKIFRITNSFGPREQITANKNAVNFLIHQAYLNNKIQIYFSGKFFRDLIYVDDVVSGIKTVLKKGRSGNLYWISSNTKTWFYQLGNLLHQLTDVDVKYIDPPPYTKKTDVGNFIVDNSKLKSLGWKPKISVKDGIEKTIEYFKNNTTFSG